MDLLTKHSGTLHEPMTDDPDDYMLRYRQIQDHISYGMFRLVSQPNGRIIQANLPLCRILGYDSPAQLQNQPLERFMIPSDALEEIVKDIYNVGHVNGAEVLVKQQGGAEVWISIQAWVISKTGEKPLIIEGLVEDITERKIFEQEMHFHASELNRYALALAQANKKLNILSSITRHDILNKLTCIRGYVELLKADCVDPHIQEYLQIQEDSITAISELIRFTKEYQDIGIDTPQWYNVRDVIMRAGGLLTLPGVTVTADTGDFSVYADPLLEKVFYNLIENALRHGGKKLNSITFTAISGPDNARIICEDNGAGVPDQYKEAIFVRKHFKNTGFGLFLSRDILGITGLTIEETGTFGKGARFEITVPPGYFRNGIPFT